MVLSRSQFKRRMVKVFDHSSIAEPHSPLWVPESAIGEKCHWFVTVPCVRVHRKDDFWKWCHAVLRGQVACFYRHEDVEQWWGFTHRRDIAVWLLKWM